MKPVLQIPVCRTFFVYLCRVNEQILQVKHLSKQYLPGTSASIGAGITDICFSLAAGQILAIIGESGSGKSTLLKCIYGLLKPDSGTVAWDGKRVKGPDEQLIPGHPEMKMVTQDFSLNIYAKVYDNIAAMLPNTDLRAKEAKVQEILERLRITALKDKQIVRLSGGEQQRVAIARALISDTRVLLLDEPFSQVDTRLKNQLRSDLKRLARETGVAIVLVSHDPADGLSMADQLLLLREGQCVQLGSPEQVYQQAQSAYVASLLGDAVVLTRAQAASLDMPAAWLSRMPAEARELVFYPEWVQVDAGLEYPLFRVETIDFRGAVQEVVLERRGILIRALLYGKPGFVPGDNVRAAITSFLAF